MTTPYPLDDDGLERLIGALYEALLQPHGLIQALRDLAHHMQADNYHLLVWQADEPKPQHSLSWGMPKAMETSYASHYGAIDPRRLAVAKAGEGRWLACHQRFDEAWVRRNEFFQDYLIPGGIRYLLGTRLVNDGPRDVFFGMHRAPGRDPFSATEVQWIERLTPHFRRAMRLWLQTEDLRHQACGGTSALDAIEWGCMAVAADGRLLFANRYAEALLTRGRALTTRQGHVCGRQRDDDQRLRDALQRVTQARRATALRLASGANPDDTYSITLVPLPAESDFRLPWDTAPVLLLIAPDRHRRQPTPSHLSRLFGLTQAEARLLHSLAKGGTLETHADAHGIAMSTVKTQLRAILAKTGTSRQAELMRRVTALPPARDVN